MRWATTAVVGVLLLAACSSPEGVTTSDEWSRPVPPVSPASAVFLEIHNGLDSC